MATPDTVLIVTVTTTDGDKTTHTYPLTGSHKEQLQLIRDVRSSIADAINGLHKREPRIVTLRYPLVLYKADHIVRVAFDTND